MTRDDITRMAREAGFVGFDGENKTLCRFAAIVAAAEADRISNESKHIIKRAEARGAEIERESRADELAECYRCGWDGGAAAEREKIAQAWDALHEQYMKDPLRRQMMLSYELVAEMIRGKIKNDAR